ncbi:Terminal oxidase biogenesis protein CtaM, putative heme A, heme O chaperone [hydrothermal vent metagenome]|uniref:Terminal oxidase biogenesis protein CtaM, putative heme A, heme O chaperone n=1 Tax=hydrothermal vent metagenome TaxID=652676 RepID=A0A3B0T119_9ZZZZ
MNDIALKEKKFNKLITIVSIVVPVVVAVLFGIKIPNVERLGFLPPIYATINGLTAILLLVAIWAIKNGKRKLHRNIMTTCIALSLVFLLMYVAYHMTADSTKFGGQGTIQYVYYFVLITHIVLSIAIIPLVLKTYARAYLGKFESHRKLAKITFPIWLYVAITGVVVYLMISPYYFS